MYEKSFMRPTEGFKMKEISSNMHQYFNSAKNSVNDNYDDIPTNLSKEKALLSDVTMGDF